MHGIHELSAVLESLLGLSGRPDGEKKGPFPSLATPGPHSDVVPTLPLALFDGEDPATEGLDLLGDGAADLLAHIRLQKERKEQEKDY